MQVEKAEPPDFFAPVAAEEIDQPVGGGDIGAHGVRRAAAIVSEMASPPSREGPCGMVIIV